MEAWRRSLKQSLAPFMPPAVIPRSTWYPHPPLVSRGPNGIHEDIPKDCSCASWTQRWGELALSRVSMPPHLLTWSHLPGDKDVGKTGSWGRCSRNGLVLDVHGKLSVMLHCVDPAEGMLCF